MQRGSATCRGSQRWCDQALGGDVVDEQVHPLVQRLGRRPGLEQVRHGVGQQLDLTPVNRLHDGLSAWEIAIQRADSDAGAARDFFQAHIQPELREPRFGSVDQ